jgi:hypothetical protein
MVVGVCEGGPLGEDRKGEDEGSWKEGGVASGRVVKRIPVDTATRTCWQLSDDRERPD